MINEPYIRYIVHFHKGYVYGKSKPFKTYEEAVAYLASKEAINYINENNTSEVSIEEMHKMYAKDYLEKEEEDE